MDLIPHRKAPFNSSQGERQYWSGDEWKDCLLPPLFSTSQRNSVIKLPLVMTANWIETIELDSAPSYSEGRKRWMVVGNVMRRHTHFHTHTLYRQTKLSQRPSSLLNGTSGGFTQITGAHCVLVLNCDLQWRSYPFRLWTSLAVGLTHFFQCALNNQQACFLPSRPISFERLPNSKFKFKNTVGVRYVYCLGDVFMPVETVRIFLEPFIGIICDRTIQSSSWLGSGRKIIVFKQFDK